MLSPSLDLTSNKILIEGPEKGSQKRVLDKNSG